MLTNNATFVDQNIYTSSSRLFERILMLPFVLAGFGVTVFSQWPLISLILSVFSAGVLHFINLKISSNIKNGESIATLERNNSKVGGWLKYRFIFMLVFHPLIILSAGDSQWAWLFLPIGIMMVPFTIVKHNLMACFALISVSMLSYLIMVTADLFWAMIVLVNVLLAILSCTVVDELSRRNELHKIDAVNHQKTIKQLNQTIYDLKNNAVKEEPQVSPEFNYIFKEISTPMNHLISTIDFAMYEDGVSYKLAKQLKDMQFSASMVQSMMYSLKMRHQENISYYADHVNLYEFFESLEKLYEEQCQLNHVELHIKIDQGCPQSVEVRDQLLAESIAHCLNKLMGQTGIEKINIVCKVVNNQLVITLSCLDQIHQFSDINPYLKTRTNVMNLEIATEIATSIKGSIEICNQNQSEKSNFLGAIRINAPIKKIKQPQLDLQIEQQLKLY